jgi:tellurite methyltransferase
MERPQAEYSAADEADRARWNDLYRDRSHRSLEPDSSFVESYFAHIAPLFAGRSQKSALDLAGGVGRNAFWLAAQGWQVTLSDLSDEAARLATAHADATGLPVTVRRESAAETLAWSQHQGCRFDLILLLYYLDRQLFPALRGALAPGGLLYMKTRTEAHPRFARGSRHPEYYLRPNELGSAFAGLRTVHSREEKGLAELLARL